MVFDVILGPGEIVGCNMASRGRRPGYHCKSQVSLLAKVTSQVHIIAWQDLLRVMRVYPDIRQRVMEQMKLSFELDSSDMVRDLWVRICLVLIIWCRWGRRCNVDVSDDNDDNNNEAFRFPNEREQEIQCAMDSQGGGGGGKPGGIVSPPVYFPLRLRKLPPMVFPGNWTHYINK